MDIIGSQEIQSEEIYKDLFDNAFDLIHFANIDGSLVYVNRSWMQFLGYTQKEIMRQPIYNFVDPLDRERFREYRIRLIREKSDGENISIALNTKNGEKRYVEGFVSVKVKQGNPVYTRGIFRDVTSKINNEQQLERYYLELKEREYNLQQMLFYAPDAIIVINKESLIRFWNPKSEEIFGWKMEEVIGQSLGEKIIPMEYRKAHTHGMKRYLTTGEAHVLNKTIDISALNKAGNQFYISLTISAAKQQGEVLFIAFVRDITQQKMNEKELERKRIEIEKSNKELEQFAHVASHDMKEPVRKIKVFTGRLENELIDQLTPNGKSYIKKVMEAADRLNNMVEGVLNYATINNNAQPFEMVDLDLVVKDINNDLELLIEQKNAIITYNGCEKFEGISFLIYQLLYNLVINSLKFTKVNKPPVIEITCHKVTTEQLLQHNLNDVPHIQIGVQDNGIGFSQENAEKIFNTFTRLHSKADYDGTGLGLTLCKNIVEKHHGKIAAYGREGEGAVFNIILPVRQPVTG